MLQRLGKAIVFGTVSLMFALSLFVFTWIGTVHASASAFARPTNCGVQHFESTANTAYGYPFYPGTNTFNEIPPHVKVVIWKACDGAYYVSAYSTSDNIVNWTFKGNIQMFVNVHGNSRSSAIVYCNGWACDSPELGYTPGTGGVWGVYTPTNGEFQGNVTSVETSYFSG